MGRHYKPGDKGWVGSATLSAELLLCYATYV